jgi:hypothetical protein
VRFNYNSTRPPPSAAIPISARRAPPSHSFKQPASILQILIANLELEFQASPIRISELKIPNRKFSAVSSSPFRTLNRKPQAMNFLIENARLSFGLSPSRISVLEISNRERTAISQPVPSPSKFASHSSLVTSRSLSNRYTAIRISRKRNKTNTPPHF